MPHRHAPQPFSAPAVSGSPVRAAPVPPLVRIHSSQNESDPERPIYEADRFNRPSFARYSEKISEDRKAAKPKERNRRKRKHRSVSNRQHTAFPHRSQRNRKGTGTKRINRGNENGRSPCHRRQHAVSGTLYGTPCGQRLTAHDIPPRPLQRRLSRRTASLTPSDSLRHRILRPNFRTAKKTRTGMSLRPDRRPAATAYRKNIRGNRPVSQYADILVVRAPSPVRAFSGTALSESEGIRPSLPCGRSGGPADRYTRSAPRPTRY